MRSRRNLPPGRADERMGPRLVFAQDHAVITSPSEKLLQMIERVAGSNLLADFGSRSRCNLLLKNP